MTICWRAFFYINRQFIHRFQEVDMQNIEIDSLLDQAGFRYDLTSGRYFELLDSDEAMDYVTEDIADQLAIPVDDLVHWEEQQQDTAR